jgi:hypothetical protein
LGLLAQKTAHTPPSLSSLASLSPPRPVDGSERVPPSFLCAPNLDMGEVTVALCSGRWQHHLCMEESAGAAGSAIFFEGRGRDACRRRPAVHDAEGGGERMRKWGRRSWTRGLLVFVQQL